MNHWRVRDLLTGLGVGLILASVLVAFAGHRPLPREEIIKQARAVGMVFPQEARLSEGGVPQEEKGTGEKMPLPPGLRRVTIPPGSSGSQIARLLEEAGVITDRGEFLALALAEGADVRFRAGTYVFKTSEPVGEVIKKLRRGPSEP